MTVTRIFLNGCNGRMGKVITEMVSSREDIIIAAGSDANTQASSFPVYSCILDAKEEYDVIIDFSHISAFEKVIQAAYDQKRPLVMCTTGLSEDNKQALIRLADTVAVFYSGNMSLGINVLICLAQKAASILYPEFDIEIIEAHHNQKLDAPSGTALMIADKVNQTLDNKLEYVYDRHDVLKKREKKEIGLHSIRGGNIVGEHSIMYIGPEEVITISHSAQTRNVFARGAVAAAKFLDKKSPGLYSMDDLVGQM